jgi:membrane protease YdiL (CAAX protease family)
MKARLEAKSENSSGSPPWVFLVLVFILSWPFLIYGFGWLVAQEDVLKRYIFSCMGMLMVAVSAFIARAFVERKGFKDVGWNLGHSKWYLVVLLFCALLWLGPPLVALPLGRLEWNHNLSRDALSVVTLSLAGFSVLAGFGEEFGWRGYLLPRLLTDRKHTRGALVIVGFVWGIWHCAIAIGPLLKAVIESEPGWLAMVSPALADCVQMIGSSIALSFIFGAVWLKSRSIFLSSFLHGYWIGIRDAASQLLSYPPAFRLVTLVVILAAWFIADRWLEKIARSQGVSRDA